MGSDLKFKAKNKINEKGIYRRNLKSVFKIHMTSDIEILKFLYIGFFRNEYSQSKKTCKLFND